jgi:hypothetical protein
MIKRMQLIDVSSLTLQQHSRSSSAITVAAKVKPAHNKELASNNAKPTNNPICTVWLTDMII